MKIKDIVPFLEDTEVEFVSRQNYYYGKYENFFLAHLPEELLNKEVDAITFAYSSVNDIHLIVFIK